MDLKCVEGITVKSVIVTGAAGFIGSSLCIALADQGIRVHAVDCLTDYYDPAWKQRRISDVREYGVDVSTKNASDFVQSLTEDVDVVFHLAAQPGVRASWGGSFEKYIDRNIRLTHALLEWACRRDCRFVFASSSSVYGEQQQYPVSEEAPLSPVSPYGVTKLTCEGLARAYARRMNAPVVGLRYFTVFGPGQRPDMAFTRFFAQLMSGRPLEIFGDGRQIRDFTYVSDAVRATILAGTASIPGRQFVPLNVAGGSSRSLKDVFASLQEIVGHEIQTSLSAGVPGDVSRTGGDVSRIRSLLGWMPATPFEKGLRAQYEWAMTNRAAVMSAVDSFGD